MSLRDALNGSQIVGVVDTFFGDSGKGKIADLLASLGLFNVALRANGGPNTGHTIKIGDKKHVLHLIPSGAMNRKVKAVIGRGVIFEPNTFFSDHEIVASANPAPEIYIDPNAHVIMPWHIALDNLREALGGNRIGTTGRGVGPCVESRDSRDGFVTVGILRSPQGLEERIEEARKRVLPEIKELIRRFNFDGLLRREGNANEYLSKIPVGQKNLGDFFRFNDFAFDTILSEYGRFGEELVEYITDSYEMIRILKTLGNRILIEGTQGVFLDIIHGTYPYVTAGLATRAGLEHDAGIFLDACINVVKAYGTRVGNGPFPSEIKDDNLANQLREAGEEYGATTRRPRRIGWLDEPALRYALEMNCRPGERRFIALTKLDVLSGIAPQTMASYSADDAEVKHYFPGYAEHLLGGELHQHGQIEDIKNVRGLKDLPGNARAFVERIERYSKSDVVIVGKGPERSEVIM